MNSPIANNPALIAASSPAGEPGRTRRSRSIYLAALSRRPTADETEAADRLRGEAPAPRPTAYSDILWAVLNSSEFTLVR